MGSAPTFDPTIFTRPISATHYQDADLCAVDGLPAAQPRGRGLYPTGSTFKPITRRSPRSAGFIHALHGSMPGLIHIGARSAPQRRQGALQHRQLRRCVRISSDASSMRSVSKRLTADPDAGRCRRGRATSASARDRDRRARRAPRPRSRLALARRGAPRTAAQVPLRPQASTAAAKSGGLSDLRQWTSATTSTSRSARATCRPRRCRWRSPTRRSPTAAFVARTVGLQVTRTVAARAARSTSRRATCRSLLPHLQTILDGLRTARPAAGGTSADVFKGCPRALPGLRQDRHRAAPRPGRPVVVCLLRARQVPADRHRRDDRAGRLWRRRPRRRPRA